MRLKNQRVWTDTPSGHKVKSQRAPSPLPSNDDEGKDGEDDGRGERERVAVEEKANSRLSFAATGAVIEAPPPHTSEEAGQPTGAP